MIGTVNADQYTNTNMTQEDVNKLLHTHAGWISISPGDNGSHWAYVGPSQCSPYVNFNISQGSFLYPHSRNISLELLAPTRIAENQTVPLQLQITNNENHTIYNVNVLDWEASDFFDIGNLTKVDLIEPHQSRIITGNLTFTTKDHITCFHYNAGQSIPALGYQVAAKNDPNKIMESNYFNSKIAITILSPFAQINLGIPKNDVECNQGFQVVIESENSFPVCVTTNTANILVERGWGHLP